MNKKNRIDLYNFFAAKYNYVKTGTASGTAPVFCRMYRRMVVFLIRRNRCNPPACSCDQNTFRRKIH